MFRIRSNSFLELNERPGLGFTYLFHLLSPLSPRLPAIMPAALLWASKGLPPPLIFHNVVLSVTSWEVLPTIPRKFILSISHQFSHETLFISFLALSIICNYLPFCCLVDNLLIYEKVISFRIGSFLEWYYMKEKLCAHCEMSSPVSKLSKMPSLV